jgi:hypothetical protein
LGGKSLLWSIGDIQIRSIGRVFARKKTETENAMSVTLRGKTHSFRGNKFTQDGHRKVRTLYLCGDITIPSDAEWQQIIVAVSKYDLKHLSLSCNIIKVIPESIATLTNLKYFNLDDNKIMVIPESFAALTKLKRLDLNNNKIRVIPESFAALTNLVALNLDNNMIANVPDVLAELNNLKHLLISENPFLEKISYSLFHRGSISLSVIIEYFKRSRIMKMAAIKLVWDFLPMPIAEEIGPHIVEIGIPNEKKCNGDADVDQKRRRINK